MKKQIFEILEAKSTIGKIFNILLMVLISLNVIAVILETVESICFKYSVLFGRFEIFSVIIFSIEYLLRLWTCIYHKKHQSPITGRIKYILGPLALIDLFAILPFYLPMIIPLDLRFIRIIRIFRIFRLFKMGRYSTSLKTLNNVLVEKKEQLLLVIFVILILLIIVSSVMYLVEKEAQPEVFSSIPATMWWAVITLTTVGYGDIYPITPLGKFLGAIIAFLGIGMFAIPAGILSSGLVEAIQGKNRISSKAKRLSKNEIEELLKDKQSIKELKEELKIKIKELESLEKE
ncbi:hypothetical protein ES705_34669 [subsurface metagenome]